MPSTNTGQPVARNALDHSLHVIVEDILRSDHYGSMLTDLVADHRGRTGNYHIDKLVR
ncbi:MULTISPECIES: hypothetical protein [Amycolatopsis]|uniref:Uncharacterized protein n=1 Tax=Amycolatopsis bullii TaxID=941987 RepID=A0ABQ3K1T2_9PSEU|nr:hypothetical protein [Amycolatopsis bullii]GHF98383.1 hypothetical protein GCM10017567_11350 [Amycolatopsis bullii]